jgi:hypothetical protein
MDRADVELLVDAGWLRRDQVDRPAGAHGQALARHLLPGEQEHTCDASATSEWLYDLRARWGLITAEHCPPASPWPWPSLPPGATAEPVGEQLIIERRCPGYSGVVRRVGLDEG